MRLAARLLVALALLTLLSQTAPLDRGAVALEQGKFVAPGRLVVAGRKLSCGKTVATFKTGRSSMNARTTNVRPRRATSPGDHLSRATDR